jgi:hypothetical protein
VHSYLCFHPGNAKDKAAILPPKGHSTCLRRASACKLASGGIFTGQNARLKPVELEREGVRLFADCYGIFEIACDHGGVMPPDLFAVIRNRAYHIRGQMRALCPKRTLPIGGFRIGQQRVKSKLVGVLAHAATCAER